MRKINYSYFSRSFPSLPVKGEMEKNIIWYSVSLRISSFSLERSISTRTETISLFSDDNDADFMCVVVYSFRYILVCIRCIYRVQGANMFQHHIKIQKQMIAPIQTQWCTRQQAALCRYDFSILDRTKNTFLWNKNIQLA